MTGLIHAVPLRLFAEAVDAPCDPKFAFVLASYRVRGLAMLHSAAWHPMWGRWTILCGEPAAVVEAADGWSCNPLEAIAETIRSVRVEQQGGAGLPFVGGWVGYLGYEAGGFVEHVPGPVRSDVGLPAARFGLYGSAAIYDHLRRQWHVVGVELPGASGTVLAGKAGLAFWKDLLREAGSGVPEHSPASGRAEAARDQAGPLSEVDAYLAGMRSSLSDESFRAGVARVIKYIEAGDVYQVNLTRRLTTHLKVSPKDLYLRLCAANPAWYAAYLDVGGRAVLSSSPELFLQVKDGRVITRPIKGTRPRVSDALADARAMRELSASEKDRAELAMIIDLMRNDLGRVCEYGSVRVVEPFGLEAHPTVFHLVGTIEGRLAGRHDVIDLLRATFPGGSITGAPKIRAMQIIRELEPVVRGVYCGCIGGISLDGQMTMSIPIRTLVADGEQVHLHVGGGVVADSQPDMELSETIAKARGMARALMSAGHVP